MASGNDKFLFLHVPKTGGNWAVEAMEAAGVELRAEGARHADLKSVSSGGRFTFAFVRDPLTWYGTSVGGTTTAASDALVIEGLIRRFGEREAIAGISATLGAGETLAVLGPNGAGKTTLLRVLATLLRPHAGSVQVLGSDLPRDAHAVRPRVGFVGHEPLLYRELTGRENLDFYGRLYDIDGRSHRIEELLAIAGLTRRADEPVRSLSRGMVQRLAICRAVLHRPALLLLDEPRDGLDPEAAELVEPLIGSDCGCARVLVTHNIERSVDEADQILGLAEGRMLLNEPASAVDLADLRRLYQGVSR